MPGDIYTVPSPVRPFIEELGAEPGVLRVGLLIEDVFLNNPVHAECIAAVRKAASILEQMGHIVEESYPAALVGATGLGPPLHVIATSRILSRSGLCSKVGSHELILPHADNV
jgi:amidase